ncbi:ABC transporter permease [Persicobacter psychrovividus]|uniref:Permease n=1 Tax=Persicobacter psychrovividus TaxID=387638 RepID=A0ABN6LFG6_9BACT|nr:permease [Persicobacter psychrovividus]
MIKFLFKGLIRDKSRSLLPVIVVALGVILSVVFSGYIVGAMGGMISQSARFSTGHVKVVTKAYQQEISQKPIDLSILDLQETLDKLHQQFPDMDFVPRINFGGMLDVPDAQGQTRAQGTGNAMALDLRKGSHDAERLNIASSIVEGHYPTKPFEILMGDGLMARLQLKIGDQVTFFGATMDGAMSFQNLTVAGTISFGTVSLDNQTFIIDLKDAQQILDMRDASPEIFGYLPNDIYNREMTEQVRDQFNAQVDPADEYAPIMMTLGEQNNLQKLISMAEEYGSGINILFIIAMSIVLWNTGLLGGLRRYQEFGIRIALGESKKSIYKSLLSESFMVGFVGSLLGTVLGLAVVYYLQEVGIDTTAYTTNASSTNLMISNVIRAEITPSLFYVGFIPGVCATFLGAVLSGRGIFKRQTSQLFNELGV